MKTFARRCILPLAISLAAMIPGCNYERDCNCYCDRDGAVASDGPAAGDAAVDDVGVAVDAHLEGSAVDVAVSTADGAAPAGKLCAALPAPTGTVIKVKPSQSKQLPGMVNTAAANTTFLLEDGTYTFTGNSSQRCLFFKQPGITLRSASGVRSKVIIDGQYLSTEIFQILASNSTVADVTIKRAKQHPVHVMGTYAGVSIKNVRLHNLHIIDGGQQFVKVNPIQQGYVDQSSLDCSLLEMTDAGRAFTMKNGNGGCYTGGIDVHAGWGWKVRQNTFKNIYCTNGKLSEHAAHFWSTSRDTLVERNVIIDCARGVGFGMKTTGTMRKYPDNPYPKVTGYMDHIDGIIRNNVIHSTAKTAKYYDTGIELSQAQGAKVYHNTIVTKPVWSSIDYRWPNTKAEIRNNLVYKITQRQGGLATVDHNLSSAPASLFVDLSKVDYHLKSTASTAIDLGVSVGAEGGLDLDGKAHDKGLPDLGAYEYRP